MAETPGAARFVDPEHRYRLSARIATGGMGEIWRAEDTVLHREVAVKLLKAEYAEDAGFRERFATEARHAAALHHPGVAAVFDFGEAAPGELDPDGTVPRPYLVMELVPGQPLSTLVRPGEAMEPSVVADLMAQAAAAVGAAHAAGIVHRDIKPANLLITPDRRVKITDFGIARAAEGVSLTRTGEVMGTPQYLSPEQAQSLPAGPTSDVYSLGVVAYECLTGRRPFAAASPVATALAHVREPVPGLPDTVPADLAGVVLRCLAKAPEQRYADGAALAAAFRDPTVQAGPPAAAAAPDATRVMPAVPAGGRVGGQEATGSGGAGGAGSSATRDAPPAAPRRRTGAWWWLAAGLVLALLLFALWGVLTSGEDTSPEPGPGGEPPTQTTPTGDATDDPSDAPEPTSGPTTEPAPEPTSAPTTGPTTGPTTAPGTPSEAPTQTGEPTTPPASEPATSGPTASPSATLLPTTTTTEQEGSNG